MKLYQMNCATDAVELYRLKDGRFQFLDSNETAQLMQGADYLLLNNDVVEFLQSLDLDNVWFEPAILWDRKLDEEIHTHSLVSFDRRLDANEVGQLDSDRHHLCSLERFSGIFVSNLLKDALEHAGFKHLQFKEMSRVRPHRSDTRGPR